MNDFEDRIRNLPWREPSAELKEKIFSASPQPKYAGKRSGVSWKWAAALTTAAGIGGFFAGAFVPEQDRRAVSVASDDADMRVIERSSKQNSFDFSEDVVQILPGEFVAYIDSEEDE